MKIFQEGFGSMRGAIGTPDQIRDLCRRYEEAGVDQIIFVSQAGRNRHEHICESMELFAKEVMPEFAERTEDREHAKSLRLGPAVQDALRRRDPPRIASPDYVIAPMGSGPPAPEPAGAARRNGRPPKLVRRLAKRGEAAFSGFVARSSDRRLELTVGSDPGLRLVFTGWPGASGPTGPRASAATSSTT